MKRYLVTLFVLLSLLIVFSGPGQANDCNLITDFTLETLTQQQIAPQQIYLTYENPRMILARRGGGFGGSRGGSWGGSSRSKGNSGGSVWKSKSKSTSTGGKSTTNPWKSKSKNNNSISGKRHNKPSTAVKNQNRNQNRKSATTVENKNKNHNRKASATKRTKRKLSKADQKLAKKAKLAGKHHPDRKTARADFKKKYAKQYTSTYKTKPATRPAHIPQTYRAPGGTTYNISYNPGYGGYGYMGPSGWMMYDMMTDMVMMDAMMNRQGYFIAGEHGAVVPIRGPGYYVGVIFGIFVVFFVVLIIIIWIKGH